VNIFLEDPRWSWQTSVVAAVTDSQGRLSLQAFDGTSYRLHAAFSWRTNSASAEPASIEPGRPDSPSQPRPHAKRIQARGCWRCRSRPLA
jgi:hypothetical protein